MLHTVKACVLAGAVPVALAPLCAWVIALLVHDRPPQFPAAGLVAVSGFSLLLGEILCLFVGLPIIFALARVGVRSWLVVAVAGAAIGWVLSVVYGPGLNYALWVGHGAPFTDRQLGILFALNAAACSALAAKLAHRNKALNPDTLKRAG